MHDDDLQKSLNKAIQARRTLLAMGFILTRKRRNFEIPSRKDLVFFLSNIDICYATSLLENTGLTKETLTDLLEKQQDSSLKLTKEETEQLESFLDLMLDHASWQTPNMRKQQGRKRPGGHSHHPEQTRKPGSRWDNTGHK